MFDLERVARWFIGVREADSVIVWVGWFPMNLVPLVNLDWVLIRYATRNVHVVRGEGFFLATTENEQRSQYN